MPANAKNFQSNMPKKRGRAQGGLQIYLFHIRMGNF